MRALYVGHMTRTQQMNIRMSAAEEARLQRVAEHYALTPTAVLRMLVKRECDALPVAKTVKAKATKDATR